MNSFKLNETKVCIHTNLGFGSHGFNNLNKYLVERKLSHIRILGTMVLMTYGHRNHDFENHILSAKNTGWVFVFWDSDREKPWFHCA